MSFWENRTRGLPEKDARQLCTYHFAHNRFDTERGLENCPSVELEAS